MIAEYRDVTDSTRSKQTLLEQDASGWMILSYTEGWTPAGSVARWTAAGFLVRLVQRDGSSIGQHFLASDDQGARAYFARAVASERKAAAEAAKYRPACLAATITTLTERAACIAQYGKRGKRGGLIGNDSKEWNGLQSRIAQMTVELELLWQAIESEAHNMNAANNR